MSWLKRSVTFDVKNGAYEPERIYEQVFDKIVAAYPESFRIPWDWENRLQVENGLKTLDLEHYYLADGRKITKPVKRIIQGIIDKKKLEMTFPVLCNSIAQLYSPKYSLTTYWGDKSELGSGQYEGRRTCFANGGCNELSRKFLELYRRTQCLILKKEGESETARCIVYFYGGRTVYLTNFYYNGIAENYRLFVEAFRRLMKLKKVKFDRMSGEDVPLPVYLNGDGVKITTDRSFHYPYDRMFPCPHCESLVKEKYFYHEEESSTHYMGCSEECASTPRYYCTCDTCGAGCREDEYYYVESEEQYYCESCYERNVHRCEKCDFESSDTDRFYYVDGRGYYCDECASACDNCGEAHRNEDLNYLDNGTYCEDCCSPCAVCGDLFPNDDLTEIDEKFYCDSCWDHCEKCREKFPVSQLEDNLCETCAKERDSESETETRHDTPHFLLFRNRCPETNDIFEEVQA